MPSLRIFAHILSPGLEFLTVPTTLVFNKVNEISIPALRISHIFLALAWNFSQPLAPYGVCVVQMGSLIGGYAGPDGPIHEARWAHQCDQPGHTLGPDGGNAGATMGAATLKCKDLLKHVRGKGYP